MDVVKVLRRREQTRTRLRMMGPPLVRSLSEWPCRRGEGAVEAGADKDKAEV